MYSANRLALEGTATGDTKKFSKSDFGDKTGVARMNWKFTGRSMLVTAVVALGGYCAGAVGAVLFGGIVAALWKWRKAQLVVGLSLVPVLFVVAIFLRDLQSNVLHRDGAAMHTAGSQDIDQKIVAPEPLNEAIGPQEPASSTTPPWQLPWKQDSVPATVEEKRMLYFREDEKNFNLCRSYGGSPAQCVVAVAPPLCKEKAAAFANDSRLGDAWSQCIAACAVAVAASHNLESCKHPPVVKWDD